MAKKIMVPLDGSPFSEHALPAALDAARRTGARLHLVQVHEPAASQVYPDGVPVYDARWDGALRAQEEEYLRSVAHRCMDRLGVSPVTELLDGGVVPALAGYAAEVGVDRIVMTSHGRGGISRAWMGSVADGLVRRASVPLLLIRPKSSEVDWDSGLSAKHVLIPLDGSELAESILEPALELGALTGARFTLLRVVLPLPFVVGPTGSGPMFSETGAAQSQANAARYLNEAASLLRAHGALVNITTVFHTAPALGILDYAATHAVDLIAMATHGRGGWSRIALGSVADKVMRGTMMPVLLYRPAGAAAARARSTSDAAAVTAPEPSDEQQPDREGAWAPTP
jgi:nucleotide-binding universal stress UspA family protein